MKAHKHAKAIMQYAQDAAETETPWERWEILPSGQERWISCLGPPAFFPHSSYRRKPKTIRIGEYDVPEPCREIPENHDRPLFVVEFDPYGEIPRETCYNTAKTLWIHACLRAGLVHLTREAAELHAKALLSFTKQPEGGEQP